MSTYTDKLTCIDTYRYINSNPHRQKYIVDARTQTHENIYEHTLTRKTNILPYARADTHTALCYLPDSFKGKSCA